MNLSPSTSARLSRAILAAALALIAVILLDKLGICLRPLRLESPASWAAVGHNMPSYVAFSVLIGGLFFFWPRSNT